MSSNFGVVVIVVGTVVIVVVVDTVVGATVSELAATDSSAAATSDNAPAYQVLAQVSLEYDEGAEASPPRPEQASTTEEEASQEKPVRPNRFPRPRPAQRPALRRLRRVFLKARVRQLVPDRLKNRPLRSLHPTPL